MERPLPRRGPPLRARRSWTGRRGRHPHRRQRRPVCATAAGCPATASTSSPATTASRSTTWSATTASTTRPTARRTATAATTTAAGTAASRARPPIPRCLRCGRRQARNHLAILLLSARACPMLLAGDEVLRSQGGNNNAYCQDNALSWFDWTLTETNRDMLRFMRELIALRRRHACLTANRFFTGTPVPGRELPDIAWHGIAARGTAVAGGVQAGSCASPWPASSAGEEDLHVILNMSDRAARCRPAGDPLEALAPGSRHLAPRRRPTSSPRDRQKPHPGAAYFDARTQRRRLRGEGRGMTGWPLELRTSVRAPPSRTAPAGSLRFGGARHSRRRRARGTGRR